MAREAGKVSRRVIGRDAKLQSAERRCADYRRAFQMLLDEPFDDLDKTIDRMLKILATTLDVGRVGFWTVDTNYSSIRCEHVFSADSARPLGPTLLKRSDCPTYFDALWHPVLKEQYEFGNQANTASQTVTRMCSFGSFSSVVTNSHANRIASRLK